MTCLGATLDFHHELLGQQGSRRIREPSEGRDQKSGKEPRPAGRGSSRIQTTQKLASVVALTPALSQREMEQPERMSAVYYWGGSANTHTTPPCGTCLRLASSLLLMAPCIRWASTPHPDCTAMYCTPSTA